MNKVWIFMVLGILLAGCGFPSVNSQKTVSETAIIPPPHTIENSKPIMNLSDYEASIPPCTSEKIQVAFDAYSCNTSMPLIYVNRNNFSDSFEAWGAVTPYTETRVNGSRITYRDFYLITISENLNDSRWSKDTIYSKVLAHELCHVRQFRENRELNEEECNKWAGWGT